MIFIGYTNNEAEGKADKYIEKHPREYIRSCWVDENLMYCVELEEV